MPLAVICPHPKHRHTPYTQNTPLGVGLGGAQPKSLACESQACTITLRVSLTQSDCMAVTHDECAAWGYTIEPSDRQIGFTVCHLALGDAKYPGAKRSVLDIWHIMLCLSHWCVCVFFCQTPVNRGACRRFGPMTEMSSEWFMRSLCVEWINTVRQAEAISGWILFWWLPADSFLSCVYMRVCVFIFYLYVYIFPSIHFSIIKGGGYRVSVTFPRLRGICSPSSKICVSSRRIRTGSILITSPNDLDGFHSIRIHPVPQGEPWHPAHENCFHPTLYLQSRCHSCGDDAPPRYGGGVCTTRLIMAEGLCAPVAQGGSSSLSCLPKANWSQVRGQMKRGTRCLMNQSKTEDSATLPGGEKPGRAPVG